jgi:hypothetical protein
LMRFRVIAPSFETRPSGRSSEGENVYQCLQ